MICDGRSGDGCHLITDSTWRVFRDPGYEFIPHSSRQVGGGYIAGATERLDGRTHARGWHSPEFDDSDWTAVQRIGKGQRTGLNTWHGTPWYLQPRPIPLMQEQQEPVGAAVSVSGMASFGEFKAVDCPANSHIEILLDHGSLTMGVPQLTVSGGRGARIKILYQEALFNPDGSKGNRDVWQGKEMKGYYDVFIPDGGENRDFEPLWLRVFRYVKLVIDTGDEPLVIHDMHNRFTAYPFEQRGGFTADRDTLNQIWTASWRTARLCALETYMDCPYYEQLQYIGDTRIQALISYTLTGDSRLARHALNQFYHSMQPMGLTQSSHPSAGVQIIPPFSLLLIQMTHDYFMYVDDFDFVESRLPQMRFILSWFTDKLNDTGLLGPLPFWNHIDGGVKEFKAGSPPGVLEGNSAHISLLFAQTLDLAAELFQYFGHDCEPLQYRELSRRIKGAVRETCYDESRQLFAETPNKTLYTKHTNSLAILAQAVPDSLQATIADALIHDPDLAETTLYFDFYVFQALKQAGRGGEMLNLLGKWKRCLDNGMTTFPEHGVEGRSDCHAWSAHPLFDFLNITCGIAPASPGFKRVVIQPQPGDLETIEGRCVHPLGVISVHYKKTDPDTYTAEITLPVSLSGRFIYKEQIYPLESGNNKLLLE
ncbi:MAG: family 78 glycoside hydrolase catalytic domain [candidate division KSB1 bacterium]|nr:family 78 glycoside hydrolase catalytic domain [candidate division KSB1 bacterium]